MMLSALGSLDSGSELGPRATRAHDPIECGRGACAVRRFTLLVAAAILAFPLASQQVTVPRSVRIPGPLAGGLPGTHQFLVHLNQRAFDPRQLLALARAQRDPILRRQILDGLDAMAAQDQLDVRLAVEALGGRLVKSFWSSNSCLVDLPAARCGDLARNTRVRRIWPNEARGPATVSLEPLGPVPIDESSNANNHNFIASWSTPSHNNLPTTKGAGVLVGFFDSGLDVDDGTGSPHSCYKDAAGTGTRLLASTLVPGNSIVVPCGSATVTMMPIDCNTTGSPGVHPFQYNPPATHLDARHGTGMSSIAVGRAVRVPFPPPQYWTFADGHAPDALAVGWSISRGTALQNNCSFGNIRWITDSATYLTAIQALVQWGYETAIHVDVLNISWDGWPDPDHPVELALDQLANDENILVVASAGDDGDSTGRSHGFYNGLSVGATKKIRPWPANPAQSLRDVASYSVRGPLQGNLNRFYPDLVAVGGDSYVTGGNPDPLQQVNLAHVDDHGSTNYSWNYKTMGASLAAAQVSGAAALYLARRAAVWPLPAATALETKAAILACFSDPSPSAAQPGQGLLNTDTYHNRNGYGRGFLRDDYLVDFAERFGSAANSTVLGPPLGRANELQTLTSSVPVVDVTWSGLSTTTNPVVDYVVAIAWNATGVPGDVMPNVDLEIWDTSAPPQLIGRSTELDGSSERVVFHTTTSAVTIRLAGTLVGSSLGVQIAARQHPESHPNKHAVTGLVVEKVAQPTGCGPGPNPSQTVDRVIPTTYTNSYGSYPFVQIAQMLFLQGGVTRHHFIFGGDTVGSGFTANALNLRTWRPCYAQTSNSNVLLLGLARTSNLAAPQDPAIYAFSGPSGVYPNGTVVAVNLNIDLFPPNVPYDFGIMAQHWNTWPIRIPFSTPFTFAPTALEPNLAIWLEAQFPSNLYVDGIDDNTTTNCFWQPAAQPLVQGRAPLFGFSFAGGQMLPDLDVFGEPILNHWLWFRASGFQMQNQPNPPNFLMLLLGLSNPGTVLTPSCFVLHSDMSISNPLLTWPSTNGAGDYAWKVPYDPAFLFRDVWAQALEFDHATFVVTQASPGLHLRIGGNY